MVFLNEIHKNKYMQLVNETQIHEQDLERKALFYIISGGNDLFRKKNTIYDFYDNYIKTDCLNSTHIDFCSSSKSLIRLGFNLYNGYMDNFTNPSWILSSLDPINFTLATHAINIRFNKSMALAFMDDREMLENNPNA